jgi:hypothetical protein
LPWRNHGFGLALESSFALAGCPPGAAALERPRVGIGLADRADLATALPPEGTAMIARYLDQAGRSRARLRSHPVDGYLLNAPGYGLFHISRAGDEVRCAPTSVAPWRWQRSLLGEVLPFVSALRGLEALHASAVVPGAGNPAIAVAGPSGRGKSSIAVELLLKGATLLADDVLAVEPGAGGVVAHPAMGLLSLRRTAGGRLDPSKLEGLGDRVGADNGSIRMAVRRAEEPVRLGAMYFLEPLRGPGQVRPKPGPVRLKEVLPPDPRLLLGSTFNIALRTPERLRNQLEACAAIAGSVRMVRVGLPSAVDFSVVARRILADAASAGLLGR